VLGGTMIKIISFFFLFSNFLFAAYTKWVGTEYTIGDSSITIQWDCATNAVAYDVSIILEANPETEYPLPSVTTCQTVINQPRSGHFYVKVRPCNNTECGSWVDSRSDSITTAGYQTGWKIYWKVAPPSPPIIIKSGVVPPPKDTNGNIIGSQLKGGWTGKITRLKIVDNSTPSCDTSHLKEGIYLNTSNPDGNVLGFIAYENRSGKILQQYLFPNGVFSGWINTYVKFSDLSLDPCIPNYIVLWNTTPTGISPYASNPICWGVGCP
jgi:hypothetical protein